MKKLVLFIMASMSLATMNAQKISASKVPAPVTSAFKKQFPDIKSVTWELEDGQYEASFKKNGVPSSANFDKNGSLVETEVDIKVNQLPTAVPDYVKKNYKSPIKEASKITKPNGEVNYEAMVNHTDLIFDANGKFLKELKEEKDDKDKKH